MNIATKKLPCGRTGWNV